MVQAQPGGQLAASAQAVAFAESLLVVQAFPRVVRDGVTTAGLEVELPQNALVERYEVTVRAERARATPVREVAEVRSNQAVSGSASDLTSSVVIDFGAMQTVAGVAAPIGVGMTSAFAWVGTGFSPFAIPLASAAVVGVGGQLLQFKSEIRTERLLVELSAAAALSTLAEGLAVFLPEPPSDLEIRIDGGPPVWTQLGPVHAPEQVVDLGPQLAALTGDPTATATRSFALTLKSRVPGVLALEQRPAGIVVRRIFRAPFEGDRQKRLSFDAEGAVTVALDLPPPAAGASRAISELRLLATGNLPSVRVVPPLGPDPAPGPDAPVLVDLVLDANRAAIVRLPPESGVALLEAVRLPLVVSAGGGEGRVVLWRGEAGLPVEPLPDGASEPVGLEGETGGGGERWVTCPFPRAVALDPEAAVEALPWAALIVSRGEVTWSLARAGGSGVHEAQTVRRGPPSGPWKPLPQPFGAAAAAPGSPFPGLRGRIRLRGRAPEDVPLAPLQIGLAERPEQTVAVTPTQRGVRAVLKLEPPLATDTATLRVVSHVEGTVTVAEIDVVATA